MGTLAGGTGLAQAMMVLALPILTRLYTPEDFSILAVFASILGIVSVAACFRLEIAIPMPECDSDSANLLALALACSAVVSTIVGGAVILLPDQFVSLIRQPEFAHYLWLLPIGIWLSSSYSAVQYWATRKKNFSDIARTRITRAAAGVGTQLGFGLVGSSPFGLLFGHVIGNGSGVYRLGRSIIKYDHAALASISWPKMRLMFRKYDQFPKYSTLDSLASSAGAQLPLIIIAAAAIGPEAGFLLLAMRAMQAPMGLIGQAVGQVYYSRAADEHRQGGLSKLTEETIGGLATVGVGPLIFAGLLAPAAFPLIFGADWERAGDLVRWMTPWFILQFLSSPVSMVMHVKQRQKELLWVTVIGLLLRVGSVYLSLQYSRQFLAESFAIASALFYGLLTFVVWVRADCTMSQALYVIRRCGSTILVWLLAGIVMTIFLESYVS